ARSRVQRMPQEEVRRLAPRPRSPGGRPVNPCPDTARLRRLLAEDLPPAEAAAAEAHVEACAACQPAPAELARGRPAEPPPTRPPLATALLRRLEEAPAGPPPAPPPTATSGGG